PLLSLHDALPIFPSIMAEFAKGYAAIGNVSIIGGSGEDGASSVVGGDNAKAMRAVFDSVSSATGLDLAAIIQGQAVGRGFGNGLAQASDTAPAAPASPAAKSSEPASTAVPAAE